jgi:hypothetical protein
MPNKSSIWRGSVQLGVAHCWSIAGYSQPAGGRQPLSWSAGAAAAARASGAVLLAGLMLLLLPRSVGAVWRS